MCVVCFRVSSFVTMCVCAYVRACVSACVRPSVLKSSDTLPFLRATVIGFVHQSEDRVHPVGCRSGFNCVNLI